MSEQTTTVAGEPATTEPTPSHPAATAGQAAATDDPGAHDFDFLHGRWRVHGRRLRERLAGCAEWLDLAATCDCWPMLGGLGNVDELRSDHLPDFVGMTVRLFDPKARQWAIYWADNRTATLDPPMRGGFDGDLGTFAGGDFHQGRAILCRFYWRRGPSPRWEQAFSSDGGETWETNWTMDFLRAPPRA